MFINSGDCLYDERVVSKFNTSYYKDRRRKERTKNKQIIRNMMANYNPEDFDDVYTE